MKCLIEGCPDKTNSKFSGRGLCNNHYIMISKLVKNKKRTWEEFERVGMALEATRGRNTKKTRLFRKMMKEKFPGKI